MNRDNGRCASHERRVFLQAIGAASSAWWIDTAVAADGEQSSAGIVDVNVSLSRWPMRRVPGDEPDRLVAKLKAAGVKQAWAGTFDGLLFKDLAAANTRLVETCQQFGEGILLPFGSINLTMPNALEEVNRCAHTHRMRGIRLHPNYHGYTLDDPRLARLLAYAAELQLIVQLALIMEDARMMHPRLRVEPVDTGPLADAIQQTPGLRLVLLNALGTVRNDGLQRLLDAGNVSVEISMLEGVGGLDRLLAQISVDRILFGSHAPLFYFEAAELKMRESSLTTEQCRAIRFQNAERLMSV